MKTLNNNGRNHKVFSVDCFGTTFDIILEALQYANPRTLAVQAMNLNEYGEAEPFAVLTVNMGGIPEGALQDDSHAFLKNWSENSGWAEKLVKDNGLAVPTGDVAFSGYVAAPLYDWNIEAFYAE